MIAITSGLLSGSAEMTLSDHLRFIPITFGKERPAGPIDQAAGKDFFFIGPAFAPEIVAGNASGGIITLRDIQP